jgi:hypothetical protein
MCGRGDCRPLHFVASIQPSCAKCGGSLPFCKCFEAACNELAARIRERHIAPPLVLRTFVTEDGVEVVDEEV